MATATEAAATAAKETAEAQKRARAATAAKELLQERADARYSEILQWPICEHQVKLELALMVGPL